MMMNVSMVQLPTTQGAFTYSPVGLLLRHSSFSVMALLTNAVEDLCGPRFRTGVRPKPHDPSTQHFPTFCNRVMPPNFLLVRGLLVSDHQSKDLVGAWNRPASDSRSPRNRQLHDSQDLDMLVICPTFPDHLPL